MYDVIVVGARCAGAPTAMLLARQGHRVLVIDRDRFPSDTVSTHAITGDGGARLERWGLLDRVLATNCPPVRSVKFWSAGRTFMVEPPTTWLCPRRFALDHVLVQAASESGVDVVEGASLRGLLWEGDTVVGVRYRDGNGAEIEERARLVVGADGRRSAVAREVSAESYNEHPGQTCIYYSYWSGVPNEGMEIYYATTRGVLLFPTNDDTVMLAIELPRDEFAECRPDPLAALVRNFELVPGLADRVRKGERTERVIGMMTPDSYFRRSAGKGWALVGDAGSFKDPILGLGINDAFRAADQLAEAADAGLRGARPLEDALADYEVVRDKTSRRAYELAHAFASLQITPEMVEGLAAYASAGTMSPGRSVA